MVGEDFGETQFIRVERGWCREKQGGEEEKRLEGSIHSFFYETKLASLFPRESRDACPSRVSCLRR